MLLGQQQEVSIDVLSLDNFHLQVVVVLILTFLDLRQDLVNEKCVVLGELLDLPGEAVERSREPNSFTVLLDFEGTDGVFASFGCL